MNTPAEFLCPPVSRVAISWVCVATNDGHPLHLDHEFAKRAGFKDVLVPGHMLIGWVGQYLEDWCGDPRHILNWKIRFSAPVWPGDQFTLRGEIVPGSSGDIKNVTVTATSQEGKVCGVATAAIRLPTA